MSGDLCGAFVCARTSLVPRPSHAFVACYMLLKRLRMRLCIYGACTVFKGGLGAGSTRKFLKFRPCEGASEAIRDHYNICWNWSVNSSYCCFSEPIPFRVRLCV